MIPDRDETMPMDEFRLHGSPASTDTDGDGLGDRDEALVGIYGGSALDDPDTDDDGADDGIDPAPLYPARDWIRSGTPVIDGVREWQWEAISRGYLHDSTDPDFAPPDVFGLWDQNALYLLIEFDGTANLEIKLDAVRDGWYHNRDNYHLRINPTRGLTAAHVLDCTPELIDERGHCEYDDASSYPFPRLVGAEDFDLAIGGSGDHHVVELAIFRNAATGLQPLAGDIYGIQITFTSIDGFSSRRATLFERDTLFDLRLLDLPPVPATSPGVLLVLLAAFHLILLRRR